MNLFERIITKREREQIGVSRGRREEEVEMEGRERSCQGGFLRMKESEEAGWPAGHD